MVRVGDGQTLYVHNPDTRLLPASNRKLFTTAAALEILGSDFTYATQVLSDVRPGADGTLRGGLYLRGVGDSALTTRDLDDLAAQVVRAGVHRVTGSVYADGGAFTDGPYGLGWEWDDLGDEEVRPDFGPGGQRRGRDGPRRRREDRRRSCGGDAGPARRLASGRQFRADGAGVGNVTAGDQSAPRRAQVLITGVWPPGTALEQKAPVADPPRYAAQVFLAALAAHGVQVEGVVGNGAAPSGALVLASHASAPLGAYLALVNKPSDNLMAESLVRTVGRVKGAGGTYDAGDAVEVPFFQKLGVDTASIRLVDGCGVGRRNVVTARAVGQLLLGMHGRPDWKFYYDSLPIAGVDGTLRSRLKNTRAAGNVHAKTGTLTGVRALSGYVTGRPGRIVRVFAADEQLPRHSARGRRRPGPVCSVFSGQSLKLFARALTNPKTLCYSLPIVRHRRRTNSSGIGNEAPGQLSITLRRMLHLTRLKPHFWRLAICVLALLSLSFAAFAQAPNPPGPAAVTPTAPAVPAPSTPGGASATATPQAPSAPAATPAKAATMPGSTAIVG